MICFRIFATSKLKYMFFFRISLLLFLAGIGLLPKAQNAPSNIYVGANGQVYVKVDAPIYFFVSPQNEPNNKILIPSSDSLANPMYFDGPGKHYFVYANKDERIRYLVLADAKGPKSKVKVEKGLLFGKGNRFYVDIDSKISIDAKDDYAGIKQIFYSVDGSQFNLFSENISFNKEGESNLKVYATDNVGNIGDTTTFKVIVSPEAIFKIDNIYFETASARLLNESSDNLAEMLLLMKDFPELILEIRAYADARGSSESNKALSERRAQSVANYLTSKGIEARRLKVKGLGDSNILNDCVKGVPCPDSKHRQNRRVEFKFSLPK